MSASTESPTEVTPAGPTATETAYGLVRLTIRRDDGSSQDVNVNQLPLRAWPLLERAIADADSEFALASLYTGTTRNFVDSLSPDSLNLIVEEGDRLNASFFASAARKAKRQADGLPPDVLASVIAKSMTGAQIASSSGRRR